MKKKRKKGIKREKGGLNGFEGVSESHIPIAVPKSIL
jgi:hypothetical protein